MQTEDGKNAVNVTVTVDSETNTKARIFKYEVGSKSAYYFGNAGTFFYSKSFTVTEPGTYTVYVSDSSKINVIQTINIESID